MMKAEKIINRMWVTSRASTFRMEIGRSSGDCRIRVGDNDGIEDESEKEAM